jgi:allophanate hydrolase
MMPVPAFDIAALHAYYATGGSVEAVIDRVYARIAEVADPGIFLHLADPAALKAEAMALGAFDPATKPLWGIPFAVKDNIDVAGMPTTAACPDYAHVPAADATVVALLREAGALVVGKTNLDQFATGLVGVRTPYPVPVNAIDPALVPGGSSSGSAVATAQGIVSFALGTDTAGSGRVPAGLNNIVGLKPTFGALSCTGVVPACRTLDCVSIFALTVADAYRLLAIAARPDPADAYSRAVAVGALATPATLAIGVPARPDRRFFGDDAMAAGFEAALDQLRALGHRIVELPFADFYRVADLLYEGAWVAERYAAVRDFFDGHADSFHPVTRHIYAGAKTLSAADAFEGFYALKDLRRRIEPLIASVDLLCVPTAPRHFTRSELDAEPIRENSRLGTYTNFVNLLDLCGIAVPTGRRVDGRPMSVTLLAAAGRDGLAAGLADLLHRNSGLAPGAAGRRQPACKPDGIDLVVVGAHLRGMPLNRQLVDLGAIFVEATRTSASYRLYELSGQSPAKPGLRRVAGGSGVGIEVEVWRLAPAAFGVFVDNVPPPLAIGNVELEDGRIAKGFLTEPIALDGSRDISDFGGWRAFIAGRD